MGNNTDNKKITFDVDGLSCASCALKIENAIKKERGFKGVSVNFATQKINLNNDSNLQEDEIRSKIQEISENIENGIKIKSSTTDKEKHIDVTDKYNIGKILLTIILGLMGYFVSGIQSLTLMGLIIYIIAYIVSGGDVLIGAIKNISKGRIFDEKFLMSIATIGAFAIGEYPEAVTVMLFYKVGEYFQEKAVNKSRKSINNLLQIRPDYANLIVFDETKKVSPQTLKLNNKILVKPGEKIPVDGIVISGESTIDTSSLTGESLPKDVFAGEKVLSGSINLSATLQVEVTKLFFESTASKIIELIENATEKKAKTENFISKFASVYTPIVVSLAVLISVIPPLVTGDMNFEEWIYKGLLFLVVSCPCALVISIPLGFFGGIAGASANGILVKGANFIEALSKAKAIVFDKTGTLTRGKFEIEKIISTSSYSEDEILKIAASIQMHSNHPIAKSITESYNKKNGIPSNNSNYNIIEIPGQGVGGVMEEGEVLVGNLRLMSENNVNMPKMGDAATAGVIHIAVDKIHIGYINLADNVKETSKKAIELLKGQKIERIVMLTGDNKEVGEKISKILGIDEVYTNLLPEDKLNIYEKIKSKVRKGGTSIFVGDGINDAPALMAADVGIAMGAIGSDAAIESSDIVIMDDNPLKVSKAIEISKKTKKIVWQNIILALSVKIIVLMLGAVGLASIWEAVFADVGVALLAVLNSARAIRMK